MYRRKESVSQMQECQVRGLGCEGKLGRWPPPLVLDTARTGMFTSLHSALHPYPFEELVLGVVIKGQSGSFRVWAGQMFPFAHVWERQAGVVLGAADSSSSAFSVLDQSGQGGGTGKQR